VRPGWPTEAVVIFANVTARLHRCQIVRDCASKPGPLRPEGDCLVCKITANTDPQWVFKLLIQTYCVVRL
jgi:hypothetical protein